MRKVHCAVMRDERTISADKRNRCKRTNSNNIKPENASKIIKNYFCLIESYSKARVSADSMCTIAHSFTSLQSVCRYRCK